MSPSELETIIRRRYNAVNDGFWTQPEMFDMILQAETEMARETNCIENSYTTSTVASQQAYAWPTRAIGIKRVTYDGTKLSPLSMREDDSVTLQNSTTTTTGMPRYYFLWENSIYLRPIPAAAATLTIWSFDRPQTPTATATSLSVPERYQMDLIYLPLAEMALKDTNPVMEARFRSLWEKTLHRIKAAERRRIRGDAPAHVHDIDSIIQSGIGNV